MGRLVVPEKCWICGNEATTREHLSKRSDIRDVFGSVSQEKPLFLHTDNLTNKKLQSSDSKSIKSKSRICENCNSSLSQPFDKAWELMSSWLQAFTSLDSCGKTFRANSIFPYETKKQLLYVHLYFVKLFGMHVIGDAIPIELNAFANALRMGKPHPNVYLRFGRSKSSLGVPFVGMSDMETVQKDGVIIRASWLYFVDQLIVYIAYSQNTLQSQGIKAAWHPKFNTSKFSFLNYDKEKLLTK